MRMITLKWLKQAEADLKAAKDSLAPTEFYEREDAEGCINSAESILKIVKTLLAG